MMEWTRRHGPASNPQPAENSIQSVQIKLFLHTSLNVLFRRNQVIRFGAV